jgi:DNA-binding CsgD family transcriptional regulator
MNQKSWTHGPPPAPDAGAPHLEWTADAGRPVARGAASRADALTEQERIVATRVASGLSNKDVAASMLLSVKTVQFHLTRVYAKLGVRSRSELAARFATRPGNS